MHIWFYSQVPESPPAATTNETASKKGRKQKEKQKEKPKGKVCINKCRFLIILDFVAELPLSWLHEPFRSSAFCGFMTMLITG